MGRKSALRGGGGGLILAHWSKGGLEGGGVKSWEVLVGLVKLRGVLVGLVRFRGVLGGLVR